MVLNKTTQFLPIVRFMIKQNSIWLKALIMPLTIWNCVLFVSVKFSLFFQEIFIYTEFLGSNFLIPTFSIGGKWNSLLANLLLATVNFEPCIYLVFC